MLIPLPTNQVNPHSDREAEYNVKRFLSRVSRFLKQRSELLLCPLGHEVDVVEFGFRRLWDRRLFRPRNQFRVDVDSVDEQGALRRGEMRCDATSELLKQVSYVYYDCQPQGKDLIMFN